MNPYVLLGGAIVAELVGTISLKLSQGFTRPLPIVGVVGGYLVSFYLLGLTMEDLPMGLIYGTWSAVGIVGIAAVGTVVFDERVDLAGALGMLLIIVGVYVVNVVSEMSAH